MSHSSDTLVVGKIGAPYGVKGWVKITTYTHEQDGVFAYSPWLLGQGQELKEYVVDQWRTHNKGLVAKLVGVETRDDAESIKNLEISIKAQQLPQLADDDFYWRELVGMQVVTEQGYSLGVVKELFETGANDVMLIKANLNDAFGQKERMVPYLLDQVVKQVDREAKTIKVDWDPAF
ncbi:MAG: ribosome maturation factor RimM [Paraglaciecola sp.]|uniref:ribosome maturation factor RimM n=1 Tax=Paraglaciecola sp. TaxID=1920173 RepID=UPI00273D5ED1|nr:ribosome maturation factor RimM [Paraglaciecola sp.]MDP5030267.1 ribosome maturation factor RimM [Paraglaciecola sp.]MDP5133837.1 ribosome maturation factor RimM [Paraglaciecola sp.]